MYDITFYPKSLDEYPCWFKHDCAECGDKELCNTACPLFFQFFHLVNLANIPIPLQYPHNLKLEPGKDANEYKFLKEIQSDITNWVQEGNNLYLFSEYPGNGKTTWAIKLMLSYFYNIMDHNGDKCRGLFINVEQFLLETKKSITDRNQRLKEMEKLIPTVDLVIWDDFGNRSLSEYDFSLLYTYINERLNNGKSNIYTSNRIDEELAKNVGWRVTDRVLNTSDVLEFINPSQRRPARERGRK